MTFSVEMTGGPVTRKQLKDICEVLGYDPADVRMIHIEGNGSVTVEVFLRAPIVGSTRGVRFIENGDASKYAFATYTHPITELARTPEDGQQPSDAGESRDPQEDR